MHYFRAVFCTVCRGQVLLASLSLAFFHEAAAALQQVVGAEPSGAIIRLDTANRIQVEPVEAVNSELRAQGPGVIVWRNPRGDFMRSLKPDSQQIALDDSKAMPLAGGVRSDGLAAAAFSLPQRLSLDQLLGYRIVRGVGLLTPPADAELLDGRVIFRRASPSQVDKALPASEYVLQSDGKTLGKIEFKPGGTHVLLSDVVDLPTSFRDGLPPGEYSIRPSQGAATSFRVASPDHPVARRLSELAEACAERDEMYAFCAAYFLLVQRTNRGAAQPFLTDALRILEAVPKDRRRRGVQRLLDEAIAGLRGETLPPSHDVKPVGIAVVDDARRELAAGRWSSAAKKLTSAREAEDLRTQRLAGLYQAVLSAESGSAQTVDVVRQFEAVADGLASAGDAAAAGDRFRLHNNYANFLAATALDRLQNQAFQAATGISGPLTSGLTTWRAALDQYSAALAKAPSPAERAAVQVNLAQLYALLADMVRSLDAAEDAASAAQLISAATLESHRLTSQALAEPSAAADVRAAAYALLAELAFRADDEAALERHLSDARLMFLEIGSPAGLESVERIAGLFASRLARQDAAQRKAALNYLAVAQFLAETLREELPSDRVGLARAGFMARRVFVNERRIELLLDEGRTAEALHTAEAGKARAMEDVLGAATQGIGTISAKCGFSATDDLLADWPSDVAALEYFLGTERAWVFVVGSDGRVTAFELKDADGQFVPTTPLVARVTKLLNGMRMQARQMLNRLNATKDYDQTWQNELAELRQILLPDAAIAELRKARTSLIVPHHVLHYLPFAALVTERDVKQRGPREMIAPRFLLDEPFDIAYAPSIRTWRNLRQLESSPINEVRAAGIADFHDPATTNLPGVAEDLKNLRAAFGDRVVQVYADLQVQQTPVLRALESPGLVLLSTHGANVADQPLRSFLRLMPDATGDKHLTAAEIYAADVGADLIVLSACFSGLADRAPLASDDLFGLQRALLHSGARCVVSGLWDVFDSSGVELMQSYFEQVAAGAASPRALATAQRSFLKKYREANALVAKSNDGEPFIHPYFWAVYTSAGDDRVGGGGPTTASGLK